MQNARPAPIQVPDQDESAGSLQEPSPLSSMDTATRACSPQELDPQMMLCNPLYSMASLSLRGMNPERTNEGSYQAAASTSVPTSQLRPEVSLCSSPAAADTNQQQLKQPVESARVRQLASKDSWQPELAPSRDAAAATSSGVAATGATEKQAVAHCRHVAAPSESESSQWFGAAAGRTAGSCVSSPGAPAPLQITQCTQVPATVHAPVAPQQAQASGKAEESDQALQNSDVTVPSAGEYASSEAAASEGLDAVSVVGPVPDQARRKRPWQPRPAPASSSCASNRPQKSSGPFFPPAARFAPFPNSRMAPTRSIAADEKRHCGSDVDDGSSEEPQIPTATAIASIPWDAEEHVDLGAGQAYSSKQQVQRMVSHSQGTKLVNHDLAAGSTEAHPGWGPEHQRTQPVQEQGRLPRLQKENSNSPEQRPVQGRAKLGAADAAHRPAQQPASPLRERNSPDAAARPDAPVARSAAAGPGPTCRRLADPGPLATSSPALVRHANRMLRSLPAEPASLHAATHHNTHVGVITHTEVSLTSPLRRSMQHIQLHTTEVGIENMCQLCILSNMSHQESIGEIDKVGFIKT